MRERTPSQDAARAAVHLTATPEHVWRLLVDRSAWWPELEFDAVAGSPLRETWTDSGRTLEAIGRVLAVDAPTRLSFEWTEPVWGTSLTVTVTVTPTAEGAEVVVTERGFVGILAEEALRLEHEAGWREHLGRLQDACSGTAEGPLAPER